MNISAHPRAVLLRGILGSNTDMPKKYQSGKLEVRKDVKEPYYFVRVTTVRIDQDGARKRVREEKRLGLVKEMSRKQAMEVRSKVLEVINAGRFVTQSQVRFRELAVRYIETRLPQYEVPTQLQYRCQIENHLLPAFGDQKLSEIDRQSVEQLLTAKAEGGLGWWALTAMNAFNDTPGRFDSRKDFAEWAKQQPNPALLFALLDGKPIEPGTWKLIEPKWATPYRSGAE